MARTPGASDAIGFSIPKDIQNHSVRKVDLGRLREMWWSVFVASILVGGLLIVAWQHTRWYGVGYDVERLQRERAASEAENRRLQLELATLRSPQRIEQLAIRDLHLVAPSPMEAVVLERVRQAAAPARTLVARR